MAQTGTKLQTEAAPQLPVEGLRTLDVPMVDVREKTVARLRFWPLGKRK